MPSIIHSAPFLKARHNHRYQGWDDNGFQPGHNNETKIEKQMFLEMNFLTWQLILSTESITNNCSLSHLVGFYGLIVKIIALLLFCTVFYSHICSLIIFIHQFFQMSFINRRNMLALPISWLQYTFSFRRWHSYLLSFDSDKSFEHRQIRDVHTFPSR